MLRKFCKCLVVMLLTLLCLGLFSGSALAAAKIDLAIDGVVVPEETEDNQTTFYLDARPEMQNRTVFVPVRVVSEILGAEVTWTEPVISIKYGDVELALTVGSKTAYKNGQKLTLLAAPYVKNDRTYVPVRFIAEAFDCDVDWRNNQVNVRTQPWQLNGREVVVAVNQVRMTMEYFTWRLDSPALAELMYNKLTVNQGEEVLPPQHYGRLPNLDVSNFYYQMGDYYFLMADGSSVASMEVYNRVNNGSGEPLPEGYSEYLLYRDNRWYNLPAEEWKQFNNWYLYLPWMQQQEYQPMAMVVEGKPLNYATAYSRVGQGSSLQLFTDKDKVTYIFREMLNCGLREVAEPRTPYGSLLEVQDYYTEQFVLGFYEEKPVYQEGSGENAANWDFSYTIYEMGQGQPEFGEDSRYLLYDGQSRRWCVLPESTYRDLESWLQLFAD